MGQCLWALAEHPINSVNQLANVSYEMGENLIKFLGTVDRDKIKGYASEVVELYENFNTLNNNQKGEAIGYIIGKYGIDIFAGSAVLKGVSTFNNLKKANRICNFESMKLSQASKEIVVTKALVHKTERSDFFKNAKIHVDMQNKHIKGKHNFQDKKSLFEHPDPDTLLQNFAGTGTPVRGEMGQAGYRERVDFKTYIGICKTAEGLEQPTTKGIIHYSKDGAHIVPAKP